MSALAFITSGGMASINSQLPKELEKKIQGIAKTFGAFIRQLALTTNIEAAYLRVWRASFLFAGFDKHNVYFIFAEGPGGTRIVLQDLSKWSEVGIERLVEDTKKEIGEVIYCFELPKVVLENDDEENDRLITEKAVNYINGIITDMRVEAAKEGVIDETSCFVIMSFSNNPVLQDFYDKAIKPTVEKYGFRCERVDEQEFNNSIRDRILLNIRTARFVLADVTEARPNCYYELGVAHALNKDVIHLANDTSDVHFDVHDFNFIIYSRLDELSAKLAKRIEGTILKK